MKCPYQINTDCIQINTLTMTLDEPCVKCKLYNNGVRPTGGIDLFRNYKKEFNLLEGLVLHYYNNMIDGPDKNEFARFFGIETKRKGNTDEKELEITS